MEGEDGSPCLQGATSAPAAGRLRRSVVRAPQVLVAPATARGELADSVGRGRAGSGGSSGRSGRGGRRSRRCGTSMSRVETTSEGGMRPCADETATGRPVVNPNNLFTPGCPKPRRPAVRRCARGRRRAPARSARPPRRAPGGPLGQPAAHPPASARERLVGHGGEALLVRAQGQQQVRDAVAAGSVGSATAHAAAVGAAARRGAPAGRRPRPRATPRDARARPPGRSARAARARRGRPGRRAGRARMRSASAPARGGFGRTTLAPRWA